MAKHLFFLGKGGVGKSTVSALTAVLRSNAGRKVLLVSLDPAHNQSDIFDQSLSEKPTKIRERVEVSEVNLGKWIKEYLHQVEDRLKKSYQYLSAFNLESHLEIIRYSPGIEEYALLMAFDFYAAKYSEKDVLIFDMPPTALTLKFLNLPKLSMLWLDKLSQLRQQIIEKREIISKIKFGNKEIESDKVLKNLTEQMEVYKKIQSLFLDPDRTEFNIVMNPDKLAISETELIMKKLNELSLPVHEIIMNKFLNETFEIPKVIMDKISQYYPLAEQPLIGITALDNYLSKLD